MVGSDVSGSETTTEPQRILFIGGLGRSGTTLIEKMLNELPGTFAVGETLHLWERGVRDEERCGCGEPFASCPHWSKVGDMAFGGWDNVDTDRVINLRWKIDRSRRLPAILAKHRGAEPELDAEQREYLDYLRPVLLASAEISGAEVLLDSSKHLSTAALLALDPTLDVRVLHVTRDPRGVAYSWTKQVDRPEADGSLMPTYKPSRTATRWVTDNLGFDSLAKLGVPTLHLRYEDMLAHPAERLNDVAAFAGLTDSTGEFDIPFLDGNEVRLMTAMHSVAGNPLRFGGDDITLRLDDAWREKLDPKARATVTRITRPVLSRYGYKP